MQPVFRLLHARALAAWLLAGIELMVSASGQEIGSPIVTLNVDKSAQTATATWLGDAGVPYQLESSEDLSTWNDAGAPQTGSGSVLSVTFSTDGRQQLYVRFKHPADVLSAAFDPATGGLTITGGAQPNTLTISRNATGTILVNGGMVPVTGGIPTTANTTLISIIGSGGDDVLSLDESNGPLPPANLLGEEGDDTLSGGSNSDELVGGPGRDVLLGGGGADRLFGGDDNDTLIGGDGDDQAFGEGGDDRVIWNPGDDTDLNEGGSGSDAVEVNGGNDAEVFTSTANSTRVRFARLEPAPFALDIGTCESLQLHANGGDDTFSTTGNLAGLIQFTIDGGADDDTLRGSNGIDVLFGGDGDDYIDGQQGNDTVFMGAGKYDIFVWDPGDGSDTLEGEEGFDQLVLNGNSSSETFDVRANGSRVRLSRNLGSVALDLNDFDGIEVNTLGGSDTFTVNDLAGTHLRLVGTNFSGAAGTPTGDGAVDTLIVNGTHSEDAIRLDGHGTDAFVSGLFANIAILGIEVANDNLQVNGLGGNDTLNARNMGANVAVLSLNGGPGRDTIDGSWGNDRLDGGEDADFVDGNEGDDIVLLGAGDDTFQWDPGDRHDVIEGQEGTDTLVFNGSTAPEDIRVTSSESRCFVLLDVPDVRLNLNEIETLDINFLGGADRLTVEPLASTSLRTINAGLAATIGGAAGDGKADFITFNGTDSSDAINLTAINGAIEVSDQSTLLRILNPENTLDNLLVNGLDGVDSISAGPGVTTLISVTLNP